MGFGPAYSSGVLRHISCSQMSNFEQCRYKWYAEKVLKLPNIQNWAMAQLGNGVHDILDTQVSTYLGKEPKKDDRLLPSETVEEARDIVDWFDWEKYFLGHEIIDSEMEMRVPLGDALPDLVGAGDVISRITEMLEGLKYGNFKVERDETGMLCVTDWKSGYGTDKGVDVQMQAYTFMLMYIFEEEYVMFRRIYPRVAGETKGWKKVEEYVVGRKDASRYERRIKMLARQMKEVAEGRLEPTTDPGDHCLHCGQAYNCPKLKNQPVGVPEMVAQLKVLNAAKQQIENALKKAAQEDDLIVGDEIYGFYVTENWSVPRKFGLNKAADLIYEADPQLFKQIASIKLNDDAASLLREKGIDVTISSRRSFKLKNEKELKEKAKAAKIAEGTSEGAAS